MSNPLNQIRNPSNSKIPRTKSVSKPSAQLSPPCDAGNSSGQSHDPLVCKIESLKRVSQLLYYIALLQFLHGLRISEVLAIRPYDITSQGFVKINAVKNSNSRIIHAYEATNYLLKCKTYGKYPFAEFNRFYVYRQYKKAGIGKKFGTNRVTSVTHYFRHNASLQAKSVNADITTRAHQLGHKSTKSTEHYEKD